MRLKTSVLIRFRKVHSFQIDAIWFLLKSLKQCERFLKVCKIFSFPHFSRFFTLYIRISTTQILSNHFQVYAFLLSLSVHSVLLCKIVMNNQLRMPPSPENLRLSWVSVHFSSWRCTAVWKLKYLFCWRWSYKSKMLTKTFHLQWIVFCFASQWEQHLFSIGR